MMTGMVAAADEVYTVLAVDGDSRHIAVNVILGQLFPSFDDGIRDLVYDAAMCSS
jgi:hypothetical protein